MPPHGTTPQVSPLESIKTLKDRAWVILQNQYSLVFMRMQKTVVAKKV